MKITKSTIVHYACGSPAQDVLYMRSCADSYITGYIDIAYIASNYV